MADMTHSQAVAYAAAIAEMAEYQRVTTDRDGLIRRAHAAGVAKAEIARRMDISRDTVVRVLGSDEED